MLSNEIQTFGNGKFSELIKPTKTNNLLLSNDLEAIVSGPKMFQVGISAEDGFKALVTG
jgi:hypothetical protein